MGYAAYVTATGIVDSLHRTEDSVDARLAADSTLSKTGDVAFPEFLMPGTWLWDAANSAFSSVVEPALTGVDARKDAARSAYDQLDAWTAALAAEGVYHSIEHVGIGHDFLFYARQALYLVMNDATYTHAQKVTFCAELSKGASDVTSPFTFFQKVDSIADAAVPKEVCSWVNPSTGARVMLANARNNSTQRAANPYFPTTRRPNFSDVQLSSPVWIDSIT